MKLTTKKIAALLLLAGVLVVALSGVALAGPPWSDASNSWWVSSYGVTDAQVATVADGYPNGTFRPGSAVTRGQFAKMAVSGLGVETLNPATATFKDVIRSNIFFVYVEGAYAADLIGGYPSSAGLNFKPGSNITRQQANSVLGRYLSQVEIDITGAIHGDVTNYGTLDLWYNAEGAFYLNGFDDAGSVAKGHKATTAYLIFRDIVQGSNSKLNPNSTLVRAQAAALVLRVKAEAEDIKTPPVAPTNLAVVANGTGTVVIYNSALQQYIGNDPTPRVTGDTMAERPVAVYDFTTKLVEDTSNSAGKFFTDLLTALADGTHSFTAKVKNANGLVSPASVAVTYLLDTVLPTGLITKPEVPAGRTTAPVGVAKPDFTATATDSGSGVKQVEFQVAVKSATPTWQTVSTDTAPNAGTTTYAAIWPTTRTLGNGLVDGQYLFRVVVTDNAGNERISAMVEVAMDTTRPTVTITQPLPGTDGIFYTEDSAPVFTATASDPTGSSGIASVGFYYAAYTGGAKPSSWNEFTLISTDTVADYAASFPSGGLAEGRYIFAVKAIDTVANESALMNGANYASGATQEVVIDRTAPGLSVTGPYAGQLAEEKKPVTITWVLVDVTPPEQVKIEYTLDADAVPQVWTLIDAATTNDGTFAWTTPDISGDTPRVQIRITAIDKAGPQVNDIAGHTTVAKSGLFTVFDLPLAPTGLTASDPDTTEVGVDGRDFRLVWNLSDSVDIVIQQIYILPASITTLLVGTDIPVATLGNAQTLWNGTAGLITDSKNVTLEAGSYKIWLVVTDTAGRIALNASAAFAVTAE